MAWTPAALSPNIWLDAHSLGLADGAAVSSWTSSDSNAWVFTQATAVNQPTYTATAINGQPGITVGAAGGVHMLLAPAGPLGLWASVGGGTILAVLTDAAGNTGAAGVVRQPFFIGAGTGVTRLTLRSFGNALNDIRYGAGIRRLDADTFINEFTAQNVAANTPYTLASIVNYSGGSAALYLNGSPVATAAPSAGVTDSTNSSGIAVGAQDNLSNQWVGVISEVVALNRAITLTELGQWDTYVQDTYGITVDGYRSESVPRRITGPRRIAGPYSTQRSLGVDALPSSSATASASLTLGGSSGASASATATGSVTLAGAAAAAATATATASLFLGATSTAGSTAAGSVTLTGTGSAAAPVTAAGSLNLTGVSTASATAAGSVTLSGTGTVTPPGTNASGSVTLTANGTAKAPVTTAGALALTGTTAVSGLGVAAGSLTLIGQVAARANTAALAALTLTGNAAAGATVTSVIGYSRTADTPTASSQTSVVITPRSAGSVQTIGSSSNGGVS